MKNKRYKIMGEMVGTIVKSLTTWKVWYPMGVVMLILHITQMYSFPVWALILPFLSPIIGLLLGIVICSIIVIIILIIIGIASLFNR